MSRPLLSWNGALVLQALANGQPYGFEVMRLTGLPSGTLYPLLRRFEAAGLVASRWEDEAAAHADKHPARRYYEPTREGLAALPMPGSGWRRRGRSSGACSRRRAADVRIMDRVLGRLVVRTAAHLAPPGERFRFVREWEAEMWHAEREQEAWHTSRRRAPNAALGGAPPPRPLRAALGAFADARTLTKVTKLTQTPRDGDGGGTMNEWIGGWGKDLRTAARGLARSPGYTAVAVLTLVVGIGGSAAMYTLIDRVVLDPLPYPEPERLVRLVNQVPGVGPDETWVLSTAQWVYFTEHAQTLDEVAIWSLSGGGTLLTPSGPMVVSGVRATASTLPLLGAATVLGRLISEQDDLPGAPPVAVLSHGFWTRVMGGDTAAVGRTLTLGDRPIEVVGVLEPGVVVPGVRPEAQPEIWLPLQVDRGGEFYNSHGYPGIGRMRAGATPATVEAELERLTAGLPERFPRAYSQSFFDRYGFRTTATPLKDAVVGDLATNLWILFGAVALVLLIACANVANLFLVRMEGRSRELAIRAALGAGRAATARFLVAEGLTLALAGGALALVVVFWAVPALTALAPDGLPRMDAVGIDAGTAAFALALSFVVGLALAAYPVFAHAGSGAATNLSDGGRSATGGPERQRLRSALVVAQVAMALTLTVAAGLLVQTLRSLHATDLGFEPAGVIALRLSPSSARHGDDEALWRFYDALLERVRALPGVSQAGMTRELPVQDDFGCYVQGFADQTVYARIEDAGLTTCAGQEPTTPGYFAAMGIPVLEGRGLTGADSDDPSRAAVVVSRAFAERFWPGEDAIGKRVAPNGQDDGFHTVVGIVGDVPRSADERGQAPLSQPAIAVYYPIVGRPDMRTNWWPGNLTLVVGTDAQDPASLFPAIRAVAAELDPEMPLSDLREMDAVVAEALAERSFISLLLGIAAAVALLLAAVGLYGVLAYVVSRRTREIGMRLAMGAEPGQVRGMIVRRSLGLALAGLVVGVALALATTRVMGSLLVGVEPTNPAVFGAAALALALVALAASWIPAWRASRVDPAVALRAD